MCILKPSLPSFLLLSVFFPLPRSASILFFDYYAQFEAEIIYNESACGYRLKKFFTAKKISIQIFPALPRGVSRKFYLHFYDW